MLRFLSKHKNILYHLLGWAAIVLLNFVIYKSDTIRNYGITQFSNWLASIFVFYITYFFLTPNLLFKKRRFLYIVSLLLTLTGIFVVARFIQFQLTERQPQYYLGQGLGMQRPGPVSIQPSSSDYDSVKIFPYTSLIDIRYDEDTLNILTITDTIKIYPRQSFISKKRSDTMILAKTDKKTALLIRDDTLNFYRMNDKQFFIEMHPVDPRDTAQLFSYKLQKAKGEYVYRRNNFNPLPLRTRLRVHPYYPFSERNLSFTLMLLISTSISTLISFIKRWKDEEQKNIKVEKEKVEAELAYLKQQINPHFLFNILNSIYSFTLEFPTPASDAILKLSSMLRYMLYSTAQEKVSLQEEVTVISDYIELQKLRLNDHTKISLSIVGDIDKFKIEPMLLIPILENAFKFGVDSVTNSFIKIDLRVSESGIFHFDVVNSIVINNKKSNKDSGIGIKNIRRRLDLIYGKSYTFGIVELNGVFRVVLSLKLQKITQ